MAKTRKKRKNYTAEQRATILSAASREHLTAAQVQRKYGVTPVTYYSWRKKSGVARRRGGATLTMRAGIGRSDLGNQVRLEVAQRVRQILPDIVRSEVNDYLSSLFAGGPGRKRSQRV